MIHLSESISFQDNVLQMRNATCKYCTDVSLLLCSAVDHLEPGNFGLHSSMFMHTIFSQMAEEQQEKWLTAAFGYELIGTYGQTELGHGRMTFQLFLICSSFQIRYDKTRQ